MEVILNRLKSAIELKQFCSCAQKISTNLSSEIPYIYCVLDRRLRFLRLFNAKKLAIGVYFMDFKSVVEPKISDVDFKKSAGGVIFSA